MNTKLNKEVVAILMSSGLYFDLSLKERHRLVKYIMESSSLSHPEGQAHRPTPRTGPMRSPSVNS